MLPILVIFLFFQALSATNEFPDLMKNIKVSWNGTDITSKLDARLTSSLDNQVVYFYLCGPFRTSGKDGSCRVTERYVRRLQKDGTWWLQEIYGQTSTYAHLFAVYDANTYTCMRFDNPIPDFMETKQRDWSVEYNCEDAKTLGNSTIIVNMGIIGFIVSVIVGFIMFKVGHKNGAESNQNQSSGAYGTYGAKNTNNAYGGNPAYNNPSYGNPFGQTA